MLVLSRKDNQEIVIGDDIRIVIVSIHNHRVRIGIDAPRNVNVIRGELTTEPNEQ